MTQAGYDAIVVGGGFYGCSLGLYLARQNRRVLILEREADLLQRASYVNQARIHNGYHYPRAILTALRSRVNYQPFMEDFREAVADQFDSYYAVARSFSKVTASQFETFCRRIGAPLAPAPAAIRKLFEPQLIEDVWRVTEVAFDAVKLKELMRRRLQEAKVEFQVNAAVARISQASGGLQVSYQQGGQTREAAAGQVYNCTYATLNEVLKSSGLQPIPFKYELTEMAVVEMPEPLRRLAVTVMCGPFFSFVPFPALGLHTLSHVRYTPHTAWQEGEAPPLNTEGKLARTTAFAHMQKDAMRYVPLLREARYKDSLWAVKTLLPKSEVDDSRPILFLKDYGLKGLTCIMGGKIDNVYDMYKEIDGAREVAHGLV